MSWRRFLVLIRGLSPNSATVTRMRADEYIGSSRKEAVQEVVGPKAAEAAFNRIFPPPRSDKPS